MNAFVSFLKNWTLPISMLTGIVSYFAYVNIPLFDSTHTLAMQCISTIQPLLIFAMLFLTFCKVKPSDLKLAPWQIWLLLLQTGCFTLCAYLVYVLPPTHWNVVIEGGMLCMICPTATAAVVVTSKLGGNTGTLTCYTILINLATAILVPALVPMIHPQPDATFFQNFMMIVSKVFPLLFCPFLTAMLLRWISPRITEWFTQARDLAFYLWAVALALAIAVTVRSIMHSDCPAIYQVGIAGSSLIACVIQFGVGRYVGKHYGEPISAAQSAGQKNTVFAIWMGYTFLDPVTSLAGGFYSVWHNIYNSYQLYQLRKNQ